MERSLPATSATSSLPSKVLIPLSAIGPLVILAIAWELLPRLGVLSENYIPSLSSIARALYAMSLSGELGSHTLISLYRGGVGFGLSVIVGIVLGVGMARFGWVRDLFHPLLSLTYPMPKPALIPLLIIWLGIGDQMKIAVIFVGSLLPVVISSYNGTRGVDPLLIWSARSLGSSERTILWKVILPAALPQILTGVRIALAMTFILLVSSEIVFSSSGLGFLLFRYGEGGVYPVMFAVLLTVALLGYVGDRVFAAFSQRLVKWSEIKSE